MRYRLLGRTGLRVSELFLGAMTFGEQGGVGAPKDECARILDAYENAGGNVVDTAINYRGGASETILGELLRGRRDRLVLSTKYTISRDGADPNAAGNHRKNLTLSLETSLRRLGTDYVDVYWVHIWDRATPVEETMRALDDAVRSGKVLYVGISDAPAWVVSRANTLAEWRGWSQFAALQVPYSLLNRDVERELLPMAEAFGMSVAAWSPLQNGILSGKYTRARGIGPDESVRLSADAIGEREHAVAAAVQSAADELGVSPAQVAIAWTMAHSPAVHPIVGARRVEQLTDNLGAAELTLPADLVAGLEETTGFRPGFPTEFIEETSAWVYGEAGRRVVPRTARG
ncbi:aldo/keto reductase [Streptomyces sp. WI04-05B]|uniref:aldo/keto reductase n=1 Tax=Streptomyces TaxID=1883 RepID=UPI0029B817BA|nr:MULTISPECIES: aldo/keto reductase [unclassified Streptomyces]MDX2548612.1 aldo/keto reductase [Streptomyces sp. WI04-05B]MDX2589065.1 aldo/keto reductase [Streptomyces sp. WI04-05A]MDX3746568.1 aldo/keto reductase [Streptomyces sp. AK08-02]